MSEAKPQDGSTFKGYRTLSHGEVGKRNQFKDMSCQFIVMLIENSNDLLRDQLKAISLNQSKYMHGCLQVCSTC